MKNFRRGLLSTTMMVGASMSAAPAFAQSNATQGPPVAPVQEPVVGANPAQAVDETKPGTANAPAAAPGEQIVVTGSRIARPNLTSNSPIAVVTGEQTVKNADITLETFLNTLPQANPAGTTTSNNPGNGGQSNINLRGLGSNRNLVLIDGRRPMSSGTNLAVDLNTIPQGLIERIDVITGGAGATYGADAIAGVVNIILKNNFEGIELRGQYANSLPQMDAREYQISGLMGANFADGRGNIAISVDYSQREPLSKVQRSFARQASSTTGTPPTGRLVIGGQTPAQTAIIQTAINSVFAGYGVSAADAPKSPSRILFNTDGTLFGGGVFNTAEDVKNYKYDPTGLDAAAANQNFFPDFYSYNFDQTNLLVLPLKRKSVFTRGNYEIDPHAEVFMQGGYTEYTSQTGLAATPIGTRVECLTGPTQTRAHSALVECGAGISAVALVVPVTNPFIPNDLKPILAARTGDNTALVGSGATEPFQISKRFLDTGLRIANVRNQVLQGLAGIRGEIVPRWRYELSYSYGRTIIDTISTGNVDVQKVQNLLESPNGGTSICENGFNPFGIHPLSADCIAYVAAGPGITKTKFTSKIAQGYITGDVVDLPAGPLSVVLGAEKRKWDFTFDPGNLFGPIAGFNTSVPAGGTNSFTDYFAEARVPLFKDQEWARSADLDFSYRSSTSKFRDIVNDVRGQSQTDSAYGVTGSWEPVDRLRLRASYQHSVRAPNFGELFSGGGSFPQYFDPCSVTTNFRATGGAAATALCVATGLSGPSTYVQTPGSQSFIGFSGNTDLKPEVGDTWTVGTTFQRWGFTGSLDYYNIKIKGQIFGPDPNLIIAACYGYFGINPSLDYNNPYCSDPSKHTASGAQLGNFHRGGGDIASMSIPAAVGGDGNGYFQAVNQGFVKTSGLDAQLAYALPTDFFTTGSRLSFNLLVNYLIDYKTQELPGVVLDYAGTVSYFGEGLGTSFPRWKANLNWAWTAKPFTIDGRIRYIPSMTNRLAKQFPGEGQLFTGPSSVWYFDFGVQADFKPITLRIGLNNAFDKKPPQYQPNVQSGTDPSLYDVIGRRAYVSATVRY